MFCKNRFVRCAALICALLAALSLCLVGCSPVKSSDDIAFTYFLPDGIAIFDHGQDVVLQVVAINEGRSIVYNGPDAGSIFISASLVIEQDGEVYRIKANETPIADDATERIWEKGTPASLAFTFSVPADAPIGHYDLEVSASGAFRTFEEVLEVHIHTAGDDHTGDRDEDIDHDHDHDHAH